MKLVFITDKDLKNEPYTTSKIIAEYGGQGHESINAFHFCIEELKCKNLKLSYRLN